LRRFACGLAIAAVLISGSASVSAAAPASGPKIEAKSWALIDARTGQTLAQKAASRRLPMASTTKMMTALLTLRNLPMDEIVRAADYQSIPGESLMGLNAGQRVSVRDLLYGLILLSGNDSAVTLAVAVSGTVPRFVALMNRTARKLGLGDTSYENPVGLDDKRQFSSARDLATLRSYRPSVEIETSNEFVRDYPWAKGIKTGHTIQAGYVLASDGRRRATELVAAVMGTASEAARDSETVKLMDYGFSLYSKRVPIRPGRPVAEVAVRFEDENLPVLSSRPVRIGVREGESLRVSIDLPNEVEGPVRRGERIGSATVRLDGERVGRVPLLSARRVVEPGPLERVLEAVTSNLVYIVIGLSAILVLLLLFRRRREGQMRTRLARAGRSRR
jgi:D-alanyl-D-alanine carboxypeptidase (penicillin-binding protein 5/6)